MSKNVGTVNNTVVTKYKSSNGMRLQLVPKYSTYTTLDKEEAEKLAYLLLRWCSEGINY